MLLLVTLSAITLPGADAGDGLRRRYLALLLQALRAPGAEPLPGRPAPGRASSPLAGVGTP